MKNILKIFVTVFALNVFSTPAFSSDTVRIALPSWVTAQAIAHLLGEIITSRLGLKVEYVASDNETIFKAMDEGKEKIDIHPDVWLPNQKALVEKYVDEAKTVTLSPNSYEGEVGFCVTEKFAKAHKIESVKDLHRPNVASLMDSDGDGKGEIWIGAEGWASANVNEVKVRDYGLLKYFKPIRAGGDFRDARIKESIAKKKGYAFYCNTPSAMWFMFDIVMLKEPRYHPARHRMIQPYEDPDWYNKSRVKSKDANKKIQIAWSNSLETRVPGVLKLLSNFSVTSYDVSSLAYEISVKNRAPNDVAKDWIWSNNELVNQMLYAR